MGFELPNGKTARNLQEQVKFLSEKLKDLYAAVNEIGIRVLVVAELPEEGEPLTIYFVPAEDASQENIYNEYMWVEDEWELIGSTEIDLSDYMTLSTNQTVSGTKSFALSDSQEYKGVITPLSSGFKLGTNVIDSLRFAGYGMYAMSKFIPEDNGTLDLGQNDLKWKDLYLSDGVIFKYGTTGTIDWKLEVGGDYSFGFVRDNVNLISYITTQGFGFNGDVYSQNNQDLGKSGLTWKDLYLSGKASFSSHISLAANSSDGTRIEVSYDNVPYLEFRYDSIRPQSYYSPMDLGSSSTKWQNLYLSGNITDGTNSVSVADLAALITYAKGQGWIS